MSNHDFESLLTALEERYPSTPETARSGSDSETVLIVPCSMSHSEPDTPLWPINPARTVAGVTTLGNQTWNYHDGEPVLDGSLAQHTAEWDVSAVLVVGHTTCSVIEEVYDRYVTPTDETPAGIEAQLDPLVSIVADAFDAGIVDTSTPPRMARHQLVGYNVFRQVSFLTGTLPDSTTVAGYVHDQDGAYGSFPNKHYLVTVDGETEETKIRSRLPDNESIPVASLLC